MDTGGRKDCPSSGNSATLARGYGFCVNKAVLLAALARAVGIPARLGFADVRNHLSSAIGKTGAANRTQAVRIAQDKGWI